MKYIIMLLIAFVAVVATAAERQSFVLNPMEWKAIYPPILEDIPVVTKQDLLIHFDLSISEISGGRITIAIRRRNNEGVYDKVGNISLTDSIPTTVITNGRWIGLLDQRMGGPMNMIRIDENDILSNFSTIDLSNFGGGYLLSDDTVVGFDPTNDDIEDQYSVNGTLRTHQYDSTNNTWTPINGTELTITSPASRFGDTATYRVYDEYMVIGMFTKGSKNFTVNIYERLANKSWNLVEAVPITGGPASLSGGSIFYNGVDTIAVGWTKQDDIVIQAVSIYSKRSGVWTSTNFTTTESVGYAPLQFSGSATFLNADTFLQGIGQRYNYDESITNAGGVLVFTRQEGGDWKPTKDLTGSSAVTFGSGLGVNDYDVIVSGTPSISSFDASFYVASRCFLDPINVTCHNPQLDDCSEISLNQLYTINNPQCGSTSVTFDGLAYNEIGGQARFTFTREGLSEVQCNASVTCTKNIPISAPSLEVPVAESVTSNSNSLQLGLLLILIMVISFL